METKIGKYGQAGLDIGNLTDQKNVAYGQSVERSQEILRILYPDGVKPEQYCDMQLITRVIDKLFRIATDKQAFGESPWKDISGYALLGSVRDGETAQEAVNIAQGVIKDAINKHLPPTCFPENAPTGLEEVPVDNETGAKEYVLGVTPWIGEEYRMLCPGDTICLGDQYQANRYVDWQPIDKRNDVAGKIYGTQYVPIRRRTC